MQNTKYRLDQTDTIDWYGTTLYRIVCITAFGNVAADEKGGYIAAESNLQVSGDAWVYGNARVSGNAQVSGDAQVYGNARVSGNAQVSGDARVSGNAQVSGNARVSGDAQVYGNARVSGDAQVYGDARVSGNADILVFHNLGSRNSALSVTRDKDGNRFYCTGCFFGTEETFEKAVTETHGADSLYSRQYNHAIAMAKDVLNCKPISE